MASVERVGHSDGVSDAAIELARTALAEYQRLDGEVLAAIESRNLLGSKSEAEWDARVRAVVSLIKRRDDALLRAQRALYPAHTPTYRFTAATPEVIARQNAQAGV